MGGENCRLQVSSSRFQMMCERCQSCVKEYVVQSCCVRCHAWVARFKMCGVKSEVRSPRCEKACTTYPTPGGSEVTHKSHRNYDNDANPSVSY